MSRSSGLVTQLGLSVIVVIGTQLAMKLPVELVSDVHRGLDLGKTDRDALNVDPERNPHTSAVSDQFTSGA